MTLVWPLANFYVEDYMPTGTKAPKKVTSRMVKWCKEIKKKVAECIMYFSIFLLPLVWHLEPLDFSRPPTHYWLLPWPQ